jgi:hypothetical protein
MSLFPPALSSFGPWERVAAKQEAGAAAAASRRTTFAAAAQRLNLDLVPSLCYSICNSNRASRFAGLSSHAHLAPGPKRFRKRATTAKWTVSLGRTHKALAAGQRRGELGSGECDSLRNLRRRGRSERPEDWQASRRGLGHIQRTRARSAEMRPAGSGAVAQLCLFPFDGLKPGRRLFVLTAGTWLSALPSPERAQRIADRLAARRKGEAGKRTEVLPSSCLSSNPPPASRGYLCSDGVLVSLDRVNLAAFLFFSLQFVSVVGEADTCSVS